MKSRAFLKWRVFNQGKGFKRVAQEVFGVRHFVTGKGTWQSSYKNLMKSSKHECLVCVRVCVCMCERERAGEGR